MGWTWLRPVRLERVRSPARVTAGMFARAHRDTLGSAPTCFFPRLPTASALAVRIRTPLHTLIHETPSSSLLPKHVSHIRPSNSSHWSRVLRCASSPSADTTICNNHHAETVRNAIASTAYACHLNIGFLQRKKYLKLTQDCTRTHHHGREQPHNYHGLR